jgi:hypothetical protein
MCKLPQYLTWKMLDIVVTLSGPSAGDYLIKMMF